MGDKKHIYIYKYTHFLRKQTDQEDCDAPDLGVDELYPELEWVEARCILCFDPLYRIMFANVCKSCSFIHLWIAQGETTPKTPPETSDWLSGVKRKDGKYLGLLVRKEHAQLFFSQDESQQKVYEIRSRQIKFLNPGDRFILVSCGPGLPRECLGVVEFQGNVRIQDSQFSRFENLHRVSYSEYEKMTTGWAKHPGFCWAWHLLVVHQLAPALVLTSAVRGCEVWMYFDPLKDTRLACSKRKIMFDEGGEDLKRQRTRTSESSASAPALPDLTDESENSLPADVEHPCILLEEAEWMKLLKGRLVLMRAFKTNFQELLAIACKEIGYTAVGKLHIEEFTDFERFGSKGSMMKELLKVYSPSQIRTMSSKKGKFIWRLAQVDVFQPESRISYMSNKGRHRVFRLPTSALTGTGSIHGPQSADISDTCKYFLESCTAAQRDAQLSGKRLRVASTCSGSDICIAVLRKTLAFLSSLIEAGGSGFGSSIYIRECIYMYIRRHRERELECVL